MRKRFGALLAAALFAAAPVRAAEVVLRHNLSGQAAAALIELANRFNAENKSDKVAVEHLSMVQDPRQLPHMALLDEEDYQKFFDTRPRMRSLQQVLAGAGVKISPAQFYPVIADTVDDAKGRMEALPLAMAIPVLYYNKDAFRKAGLNPDQPPRTWWEVQQAAGKLFDAGYRCPLTSSSPAWVHVENLSTQHSEPISARSRNGREQFSFNSLVHVKHLALLASWHKSFYFHYFGRGREADQKFALGECTMLTSDSALYKRLAGATAFEVGMADLPYYDDVRDAAPGRVLPDGPALWALAGKKKDEYRAIARFVAFLLKPEVQKEWVSDTHFLPMTPAAAASAEGEPEALRNAVRRLGEKRYMTAARLKLLPGFERVRSIMYEELEAVWANHKPAKEALDTAVRRGNDVLRAAPLGLMIEGK